MTTGMELVGICRHCGGWGITGNLYEPDSLKACEHCKGSGRAGKA